MTFVERERATAQEALAQAEHNLRVARAACVLLDGVITTGVMRLRVPDGSTAERRWEDCQPDGQGGRYLFSTAWSLASRLVR